MKHLILLLLSPLLATVSFATIDTITAIKKICVGDYQVLSDVTMGGRWSSGNIGVATIDSNTGDLAALSQGTAIITYTVDTNFVIAVITVNPVPPPITGPMFVCLGSSITLKDSDGDSTAWDFDLVYGACYVDYGTDTSVRITGIRTSGYDLIIYRNKYGCSSGKWVYGSPIETITGDTSINVDSTTILNAPSWGGRWSSVDPSIATVDSVSGLVTGISPGIDTIYYDGRCLSNIAITVLPPLIVSTLSARNSAVEIYPNPSTTSLTVSSPYNISQIIITNLFGQTVSTNECNTQKAVINIETYPSGVYLVKVNNIIAGRIEKR